MFAMSLINKVTLFNMGDPNAGSMNNDNRKGKKKIGDGE